MVALSLLLSGLDETTASGLDIKPRASKGVNGILRDFARLSDCCGLLGKGSCGGGNHQTGCFVHLGFSCERVKTEKARVDIACSYLSSGVAPAFGVSIRPLGRKKRVAVRVFGGAAKMSVQRDLGLPAFIAAEANLRALMDELVVLRELIRANPNYTGDWLDHPQWRRTRKRHRATAASLDVILCKRRSFEVHQVVIKSEGKRDRKNSK